MIKIPAANLIDKPGRPRQKLYAVITRAVSGRALMQESVQENMEQHRAEHLDFLSDLNDSGNLIGAGPTLDRHESFYEGGGIYILRADTVTAAIALAEQDPFHQRGVREFEVYPWLLSEGLLSEGLLSEGLLSERLLIEKGN